MALAELRDRGLIANVADPAAVERALATRSPVIASLDAVPGRLGIDHLVLLQLLSRLQRAGHRPIVVVRGVAALTGDRATPRDQLAGAVVAGVDALRTQLARVLDLDDPATGAQLVLDLEHVERLSYLELLRDVGKYLTVNYLATRPSIERAPELTYGQLCQFVIDAYAVVEVARTHAARLAAGAAGQRDVIDAACELGRRMKSDDLTGLVAPALPDRLLRVAEEARLDLDPERTQPFRFFQYWLNASDADVGPLLRMFSPRPLAELDELVRAHDADRAKRTAQRELAAAITDWVHGEAARGRAEIATRVMFGGTLDGLRDEDLAALTGVVPTIELPRPELEAGIGLIELIVRAFGDSKSAARKLIASGGAYINNVSIKDLDRKITLADLATETMLVVGSGRKNRRLVRVV